MTLAYDKESLRARKGKERYFLCGADYFAVLFKDEVLVVRVRNVE